METWKLLLITLLAAVLLGCLGGVLVGKHQLKKRRPDYKPLLSGKERVIYFACILFGAACIAFGLLYTPPGENIDPGMTGMEDGMVMEGEAAGGSANNGAVVYHGGGTATAEAIVIN